MFLTVFFYFLVPVSTVLSELMVMEGSDSQLCARITLPFGFDDFSFDQLMINATYRLLATTATYGDGIHLYELY